jgi:hypothetical protein
VSAPLASAVSTATPAARRGMPPHRLVLLWLTAGALLFAAIQTGWRLWLSNAGEPVVGIVEVASDSCRSRHRANCYLGRAVVDPKMERHRFKTTKISGGRFYTVGEEVPMRVHPSERLYLAAVYTPVHWLLGPVRSGAVALLWLFAALMPARRKALWIVPCVLSLFLIFG